jgi:hypothetical protein
VESQTFDDAIHKIANEIADLVISKQKDYGNKNILNSPFGAIHGIIVRLYDKIARITNLTKIGASPNNESLLDSWKDVIGYSLIAIMVYHGLFELPLEKTTEKDETGSPY